MVVRGEFKEMEDSETRSSGNMAVRGGSSVGRRLNMKGRLRGWKNPEGFVVVVRVLGCGGSIVSSWDRMCCASGGVVDVR